MKDNHKEASQKIISLFARTVQSRAKMQGHRIGELEAKDITVKAIWEISGKSGNWFNEFKENLYFLLMKGLKDIRKPKQAE